MGTIFTCANTWRNRDQSDGTFYYPATPPPMYRNQHSLQFPFLELSKRRTIPEDWFDALCYIYAETTVFYEVIRMRPANWNKNSKTEFKFVNYRLDNTEADEYAAWMEKSKRDFMSDFPNLLISEMKVGFGIDAQNSCFICSFTDKASKSKNQDSCLTSRSNEWEESYYLNLFKLELFNANYGGVWRNKVERDNWG